MKKITLISVSLVSMIAGLLIQKNVISGGVPAPVPASTPLSIQDAHHFSAIFRTNAGYCNSPNRENYFELSGQTIEALADAANDIKEISGGNLSSMYRCIYGQDEAKVTFLMIVALDQNGNEYQTGDFMKRVQGGLPCPTYCDNNKSTIVNGDPSRGENKCK